MSGGDAGYAPAAWTAEDQRWYADLVVHSMAPKKSRTANDVRAHGPWSVGCHALGRVLAHAWEEDPGRQTARY